VSQHSLGQEDAQLEAICSWGTCGGGALREARGSLEGASALWSCLPAAGELTSSRRGGAAATAGSSSPSRTSRPSFGESCTDELSALESSFAAKWVRLPCIF